MKDQVILGPNGELGIAVPLFRYHHEEPLANLEGYSIALTNGKPLAYVIDDGSERVYPIIVAAFVEKKAEFLGDL